MAAVLPRDRFRAALLFAVVAVLLPCVSAEERPLALGINTTTNNVFVVYTGSNTVTVLDGATLSARDLGVGGTPIALAVNPITNKIYVANSGTNDVTVIDGSTLTSTTVSVGSWPQAVAVNPETNKIYVANNASASVTVIDGVTNETTTVSVGSSPQAVAVNPVTNKVYVANLGGNDVTVIDGATNATSTVGAGQYPYVVAVNPVTNKVYVGDGYGNVTVIDGATNGVATVQTAGDCVAMAINPDTNKIYVASQTTNKVTVIDGMTNGTTIVDVGAYPLSVAVNSVTNTIYVANFNGGNVTVIDGTTNNTTTVNGGEIPHLLAVNPVTNKIYVANWDHAVTVIDGATAGTASPANITSPEPGTKLAGSSVMFQWSAGVGVTYYQMWIGTTEAGHDLKSVSIPAGITSYTADNLPMTGQTLYVRLNSVVNSEYLYKSYTYTAAGDGPTPVTPVLGNLSQTYDGSAKAVTVTSPVSYAVTYTGIAPTSYSTSSNPPTDPGSYAVVVTVTDPNYVGSASGTLVINQADPGLSLALVSGSPEPSPYGTRVYFDLTTTVAPRCPTGTVTFYIDHVDSSSQPAATETLDGVSCSQPVSFSSATMTPTSGQPHLITAVYSGDGYYLGATSNAVPHSVTAAGTAVTLASSGTSAYVGDTITFTATVSPAGSAAAPSGTVQFNEVSVDGQGNVVATIGTLGTAPVSATSPYTAAFSYASFGAGTHYVQAVYVNTDGLFGGSSSAVGVATVNLIAPAITWQPTLASIVYGKPLSSEQLNTTASDSHHNNAPVPGNFTYDPPLGTILQAGTRNVIATFTPADAATYTSQTSTVTITVTPATLTVTADNASRSYGGEDPSFTYQYSGFVDQDGPSAVTTAPACSTTATVLSAVGTYDVVCSGAVAANYSLSYEKGTLTVTPAALTITASNASKNYGQTLTFAGTEFVASGLVNSDAVTSVTLRSAGAAAGATVSDSPYSIAISGALGTGLSNYTISYADGSLTVNGVNVSVTPAAVTKVYGSADPVLTGTLTGFLASDNVTASFTRAAGETVGDSPYKIIATLSPAAALANYNVTYNTGAFTITPKPLTVTANDATMTFGTSLPTLTGIITGVMSGDGITAFYSTTATAGSGAGTYSITPQLSDPNSKLGNYAVTSVSGMLTISKANTSSVLQTSAALAMLRSNVTLTVHVLSATSGVPNGSVTFMDGSTSLGTATLDNTGSAALTLSTLSAGSHTLTAVYSGDGNFTGATSAAVTETIQDFQFVIDGGTGTVVWATVQPGGVATYQLQIRPMNGTTFASAVSFTLTGLPAGATYTVTPATIAAGSGAQTITVKVQTASAVGSLRRPYAGSLAVAFGLLFPMFGMVRLRTVMQSRKQHLACILVLLVVIGVLAQSACGGGGSAPGSSTQQSQTTTHTPQTYSLQLNATSGALQHSTTLALTVQ